MHLVLETFYNLSCRLFHIRKYVAAFFFLIHEQSFAWTYHNYLNYEGFFMHWCSDCSCTYAVSHIDIFLQDKLLGVKLLESEGMCILHFGKYYWIAIYNNCTGVHSPSTISPYPCLYIVISTFLIFVFLIKLVSHCSFNLYLFWMRWVSF